MKNVSSLNFGISVYHIGIDEEYKRIIRKLRMYGLNPSGSKTTDFERLREIELRILKTENTTSTKFITLSQSEQEKIQEKKHEQFAKNNCPNQLSDMTIGQRALGEQLMLAIKMKKKLKNSQ